MYSFFFFFVYKINYYIKANFHKYLVKLSFFIFMTEKIRNRYSLSVYKIFITMQYLVNHIGEVTCLDKFNVTSSTQKINFFLSLIRNFEFETSNMKVVSPITRSPRKIKLSLKANFELSVKLFSCDCCEIIQLYIFCNLFFQSPWKYKIFYTEKTFY